MTREEYLNEGLRSGLLHFSEYLTLMGPGKAGEAMAKVAEQRAREAYPFVIGGMEIDGKRWEFDGNEDSRRVFKEGYEVAIGDFAPTDEQMRALMHAIVYYKDNWVSREQKLLEAIYNNLLGMQRLIEEKTNQNR